MVRNIVLAFCSLLLLQLHPSCRSSSGEEQYEEMIPSAVLHSGPDSGFIACDSTLWDHVYNAERLFVVEKCKKVNGYIRYIRSEKDGDFHILLELDKGQEKLINGKNIARQKGCLVVEPVCAARVTQPGAEASCGTFVNRVKIPPAGTHVTVTGTYVLDKHHGWMEIHPVTGIEIIP